MSNSEKKIVVPDGMLNKVMCGHSWRSNLSLEQQMLLILESALRWLSENPIQPTEEQLRDLRNETASVPGAFEWNRSATKLLVEWQRRMFLASEPEDEIVSYLKAKNPENKTTWQAGYNAAIADVEAYRRGKESR